MHNGQPIPNLRCKKQVRNGLEGLLEIVGLELMSESVRALLLILFAITCL